MLLEREDLTFNISLDKLRDSPQLLKHIKLPLKCQINLSVKEATIIINQDIQYPLSMDKKSLEMSIVKHVNNKIEIRVD